MTALLKTRKVLFPLFDRDGNTIPRKECPECQARYYARHEHEDGCKFAVAEEVLDQ